MFISTERLLEEAKNPPIRRPDALASEISRIKNNVGDSDILEVLDFIARGGQQWSGKIVMSV